MTLIFYLISFFLGLALMIRYFPELLDYVIEKAKNRGLYNGPWKTHLLVGKPEISKIEKAAVVRVGLGANSSDETIYWNAFTDSEGNELNSEFRYQVIFQEALPIDYDNKGFWSVTVYGEDKFLVANDEKKYMVRYSADYSGVLNFPFVINLSRNVDPESVMDIPLPQGKEKFSLALRCYRTLDVMKNISTCGQVRLPDINKIA